ncbi:uncharacterized protein KNAG_0A06870 [Huiozyma naganishii CBS 8797]|uniref:Uncharacterized protein n=1 Tax=Huiozyma naganishii (strain ATCC MYA-139 / BCRC 22969 / CBS 8797 / KCTC 17520 / NBRC 10181 / NCYC 3082 / Yp74L-3) TaxID=1071383 RepID=J7S424_HUIN7|nr:hypothetical protein KNAG_0A06870 [Kazachstania naganishii CBS 8797]CCK68341.1 hypothetical protein KNAG_0A06870 [Kazachstania naganishii CBS 8797]
MLQCLESNFEKQDKRCSGCVRVNTTKFGPGDYSECIECASNTLQNVCLEQACKKGVLFTDREKAFPANGKILISLKDRDAGLIRRGLLPSERTEFFKAVLKVSKEIEKDGGFVQACGAKTVLDGNGNDLALQPKERCRKKEPITHYEIETQTVTATTTDVETEYKTEFDTETETETDLVWKTKYRTEYETDHIIHFKTTTKYKYDTITVTDTDFKVSTRTRYKHDVDTVTETEFDEYTKTVLVGEVTETEVETETETEFDTVYKKVKKTTTSTATTTKWKLKSNIVTTTTTTTRRRFFPHFVFRTTTITVPGIANFGIMKTDDNGGSHLDKRELSNMTRTTDSPCSILPISVTKVPQSTITPYMQYQGPKENTNAAAKLSNDKPMLYSVLFMVVWSIVVLSRWRNGQTFEELPTNQLLEDDIALTEIECETISKFVPSERKSFAKEIIELGVD